LWVALVNPGAAITIPNTTLGMNKDPQQVAGMTVRVRVQLVVLREDMKPESSLTTFFHEYGHACYEREHPSAINQVDSEVAAIGSSLQSVWWWELKSLPTAKRSIAARLRTCR
jgi:hypothetical protein